MDLQNQDERSAFRPDTCPHLWRPEHRMWSHFWRCELCEDSDQANSLALIGEMDRVIEKAERTVVLLNERSTK